MFFDPQAFGFVNELVSGWRLMRQEWQELAAPVLDQPRRGSPHFLAEELMQANGWTSSWQAGSAQAGAAVAGAGRLTYLLSYHGMLPDKLGEAMPATARILSRLQGAEMCALSLMPPGSFAAPYANPDLDGRLLTLHLGLAMEPGRCYLAVSSEVHEEAPGKVLLFNAGREHYSINMGASEQVGLCVEFDPRTTYFDPQD